MDFDETARLIADDAGRGFFDQLRLKGPRESPSENGRNIEVKRLLELSARELRTLFRGLYHEATSGEAWQVRGWYHHLYRDVFRGHRVLGIGSGIGIDALHFIENGAIWHFADIANGNLELMRKLVDAFGFTHDGSTHIKDLTSLDASPRDFDFIYCRGFLLHLPFEFARQISLRLLGHLKPGGRWIEFCCPDERWSADSSLPSSEQGDHATTERMFAAERYDLARLRMRFSPVAVNPVLTCKFDGNSCTWFDLKIDYMPDKPSLRLLLKAPTRERLSRRVNIVLPTWLPYRKSNSILLHGATATVHNGVPTITTGPDTWFNAIQITIRPEDFGTENPLDPTNGLCPAILVDIVVHQGCVGVGLLAEDQQQYVDREWELRSRIQPYHIELRGCPGLSTIELMLRNAQGGNASSRFSIIKVIVVSIPVTELAIPVSEEVDIAPVIALSTIVQRYSAEIETDGTQTNPTSSAQDVPVFVEVVDVVNLGAAFNFKESSGGIPVDYSKRYLTRKMESDDAPILAYLYRNHGPSRHLEFGTWEGFGAVLCAQNSEAEIWTLNLPEGETASHDRKMYVRPRQTDSVTHSGDAADRTFSTEQTDSGIHIGRKYREAGLEHRVHQILADSLKWNIKEFGSGFFDSVLIDGGHQTEVVTNDTEKALLLLRSGGLMMWHDFCPADSTMQHFSACRGVANSIHANWHKWSPQFERLFWIRPSFLLVGIKR